MVLYFIKVFYILVMQLLRVSGVVEYKVGVIIISDNGSPYDVERTGPAIELAFEKVNSDLLNDSYKLMPIRKIFGPHCDASMAPGKIFGLL